MVSALDGIKKKIELSCEEGQKYFPKAQMLPFYLKPLGKMFDTAIVELWHTLKAWIESNPEESAATLIEKQIQFLKEKDELSKEKKELLEKIAAASRLTVGEKENQDEKLRLAITTGETPPELKKPLEVLEDRVRTIEQQISEVALKLLKFPQVDALKELFAFEILYTIYLVVPKVLKLSKDDSVKNTLAETFQENANLVETEITEHLKAVSRKIADQHRQLTEKRAELRKITKDLKDVEIEIKKTETTSGAKNSLLASKQQNLERLEEEIRKLEERLSEQTSKVPDKEERNRDR